MSQKKISTFRGNHAFLSNFYPCEIWFHGFKFNSVEAAFQASKVEGGLTPHVAGEFARMTPQEARRRGRMVKLRKDWEDVKIGIMAHLVLEKFSRNPELRTLLLATGDAELIEGNTWGDTFWGVCNGQGKNMLGILLMSTRKQV